MILAGCGTRALESLVLVVGLCQATPTQFFEFIKNIADFSTDGNTVRLPPVLIQPMAADDVASAVGRIAVGSPLNGTVEVGGRNGSVLMNSYDWT